ncbi:MAG: TetR/AcrR family transcriptional regulator [Pseudomonadales bacterium]|nr:TetR/AcrR family transcriptional regulator [Pseudomonadales bacterium]
MAKSRTRPGTPDPERPALQQRSREKRDLLIKAGIRAFARDGYDGAKIADIAQDAGISVGVFYQRFKDKRGFFTALEARFMERGRENWDRFCNSADPNWTAGELLTHMVRNMGRVISRNQGFFQALVTLGYQDKTVIGPGMEMDRHGASRVADLLLARGFVDHRTINRERVYLAIANVSKILILMTLFDSENRRATEDHTVQELTLMIARYLEIEI